MKKRKQGRPLMTSETRKEEHIAFRTTFSERIELDKARALVGEKISQFCKLSVKARIRWVLENHQPLHPQPPDDPP